MISWNRMVHPQRQLSNQFLTDGDQFRLPHIAHGAELGIWCSGWHLKLGKCWDFHVFFMDFHGFSWIFHGVGCVEQGGLSPLNRISPEMKKGFSCGFNPFELHSNQSSRRLNQRRERLKLGHESTGKMKNCTYCEFKLKNVGVWPRDFERLVLGRCCFQTRKVKLSSSYICSCLKK